MSMKFDHIQSFTSEDFRVFDRLRASILVVKQIAGEKYEYVYTNRQVAMSLGYELEELEDILKVDPLCLVYPADYQRQIRDFMATPTSGFGSSICRYSCKDGSFLWSHAHLQHIFIDGKPGIFALYSSVHDLIGTQESLESESNKWADIVASVPIGLLIFSKNESNSVQTISINDLLLKFANHVGHRLDGNSRDWTAEEMALIINQNVFAFTEEEDIQLIQKMMDDSEHQPISSCTFRLRGSKQSQQPIYIYSSCISKPSTENTRTYYVSYQDVTAEHQQREELILKQEQLTKLSYNDSLTGVKNRNAFNEFANHCKTNRIYNVGFAFCDLNGLKKTNDNLGHFYGDTMLIQFVHIVEEFFSDENIYRLSGDEFVIIVPEIDRGQFLEKMGRLLDRIANEDNIASVGYIWKKNVSDLHRRVNQAEQIMYVEKQRYYETTRTITSKHRPKYLEELLDDLENGRFRMYLQPKTTIDGSRIHGAEALVRKLDDNGTIIPPYEFIPMLEHEKLIPKVDFFMLEEVCSLLQALHEQGNDDFTISVNMSRITLVENDYLNIVSDILAKYSFPRHNLEFEVTESSETMDSSRFEDYINRIKGLGLMVSLDDVGTDYSSLPLLILDGIDWVKLDRSLIVQIDNIKASKLLKHIIDMSHDLGLRVVAEGVETDEVRRKLEEMGCDLYQGYLKSKPIPTALFIEKFLS